MKKHLRLFLALFLLLIITGCTAKNPPPAPGKITSKTPPAVEPSPSKPSQVEETTPPTANEIPAAEKVESYSWYLIPNREHEPPRIDKNIENLLAPNQAFYVLPNQRQEIFLTFDNGYELGYTPRILDTLRDNQVKAAFFVTGHYIKSQPELAKRMKAEGHLVCNHTMNHPDISHLSKEALHQEISTLEETFRKTTGYELDKYLRPPSGVYSVPSLKYTKELGYSTVFWSLAFKDWDPNAQPGADFSHRYVLENIHPGAVILLHAVSSSDTEALDQIIKDLKSQGYTFATFDGKK